MLSLLAARPCSVCSNAQRRLSCPVACTAASRPATTSVSQAVPRPAASWRSWPVAVASTVLLTLGAADIAPPAWAARPSGSACEVECVKACNQLAPGSEDYCRESCQGECSTPPLAESDIDADAMDFLIQTREMGRAGLPTEQADAFDKAASKMDIVDRTVSGLFTGYSGKSH